jgi:hypothetical protein
VWGQGGEGGFLVVGQRYDLDVTEMMDFSPGWDERLRERVQAEGKLHAPAGSDYFIYPRGCYTEMPKFAVGRPMWDNWTIYHALCNRWPVINATQSVLIIHENHDYSHLPGGQPPYRLPEAARNIRLAGGKRRAMYLYDTSHVLENGQVRPAPLTWKRFWRLVETFPILRLNSYALAEVSYAIFHPAKALGEWRGRIVYKLRQLFTTKALRSQR